MASRGKARSKTTSARPRPVKLKTVSVGRRVKELAFEFLDADLTGSGCVYNEFLLVFPLRVGGVYRAANLSGTWTALVEPDGDFYITTLNASVSSIDFPLVDSKTGDIHSFKSGRLEASLIDLDLDKSMSRQVGPLNVGKIDYETGFTRITWGLRIHSPQLAALDIDPIHMVLPEIGFRDAKTGVLYTSGAGIVIAGPFVGLLALCGNVAIPACILTVDVPDPVQNAVPVTVRITRSPAPTAPITVALSGTVFGNAPGTATIAPGTVTLTPAAPRATATLTVTGARANAKGRIDANSSDGQMGIGGFSVL